MFFLLGVLQHNLSLDIAFFCDDILFVSFFWGGGCMSALLYNDLMSDELAPYTVLQWSNMSYVLDDIVVD